jgi:SEC-C motif-containing protein
MRSRYSAYVLKLEPYLLATWHPDTRPASLNLETEATKWLGLEIRNSPNAHGKDATPDNKTCHARFPHPNPLPEGEETNERLREFHIYRATVEFVARYKVGGRAHRLHEVSRFVLEEGRWFYLDGSFPA